MHMMSDANAPAADEAIWSDLVLDFAGAPVYAKRRRGQGIPLLFLHGFGDYGDCWRGLLARLPHTLDVTLLDSFGHGHSGVPAEGCDSVSRREATIALLREHLGQSVLVGHSMGAATAVAVAAQAPELVAALVLEDPPWWVGALDAEHRDPLKIARGEPIVQWIEGMQQQTLDEVVAYARSDHPGWDEVEYEDWARSKQRMNLASVDLPFRDIAESLRTQWAAVQCPALLLTGDVDRGAIVTDEVAQQFLTGVAGGERSHHPSASHDVRRDAAADVSAAITDFLHRRAGFAEGDAGLTRQ